MLLTVSKFCESVRGDLNGLIHQLDMETSRVMQDIERRELASSYQQVAVMLGAAMKVNPAVAGATISTTGTILEYNLPKASAWCDLVLVGDGVSAPEVIIIELKNYREKTLTLPGSYEGLIFHNGVERQHPAAQVRQYTLYCQYFHSVVVDEGARCSGLVYFTDKVDLRPYKDGPNATLCEEYPLYNSSSSSTNDLAVYIADTLKKPDFAFANRFVKGEYKQDRNILRQVAKSLATMKNSTVRNPFVLLDNQDFGFNKVLSIVKEAVEDETGQKQVVIVSGPPGSGKSAVAANLWVECAKKHNKGENVVFVATSSSQYDPWTETFSSVTGKRGAKGFILTANKFNPGIDKSYVGNDVKPYFSALDPAKYINSDGGLRTEYWKDYLAYAVATGHARPGVTVPFISIVDEAHALVDPTAPHYRTNKDSGWCRHAGPQAWHIINNSRVSVFLMDSRQSFRDQETTSIDSIKAHASELGAAVTEISLDDMQFRCAGSKEYVEWVDGLFSSSPVDNYSLWGSKFEFHLADSPSEVEAWLRSKNTDSIRLLSSYTMPWVSKGTLGRVHGSCRDYDFTLEGGRFRKFWNNPNAYDIFVKAVPGTTMNVDPLSEIGCPYAVRGYDYDYVGLLSLSDLLIRDGKPVINFNRCEETATGSKKKLAKEEARMILSRKDFLKGFAPIDFTAPGHILEYASTIAQAYRILLTRGIKGVCLYIEDEETREYVRRLL